MNTDKASDWKSQQWSDGIMKQRNLNRAKSRMNRSPIAQFLNIAAYPLALVLWVLVRRNYVLREKGLLPDKWYWADVMLIQLGYVCWYSDGWKLSRIKYW